MKEKPYKFVVRLPTSMRDRIAESAQLYRRSMNSEIVARLQESFSGLGSNNQDSKQPADEFHDQLSNHVSGTPSNHRSNHHSNQVHDRPGPGLNVHLERILRQQLDADEEQILQGYRQLGKTKRAALLKLLGD